MEPDGIIYIRVMPENVVCDVVQTPDPSQGDERKLFHHCYVSSLINTNL